MTKGAKVFWGAVVLAIVVIVVALSRTPSGTPTTGTALPEGPIKIGAVVPLTGEAAAYGIPEQRVALLAIEEINQQGGIAGHLLEVVWEDGKCDGKEASTAAQKLINIDQVKIIFGGACSSETLAMAPLTETAKVIVISPSSTSPDVTAAGDFIFRTAPSDSLAGAIAADYAYVKLGARTAAIISETKDYTQGLRKVFYDQFTAKGGTVLVDETFSSGDTDFRTQILKIKNANPSVVYILPQAPPSGVLIAKQLTANGVEAMKLTAEVLIAPSVISENGADLEGFVGIEPWFDAESELTAAMIAKYKTTYNEDLTFPSYQANMYSQFSLVKEAIEEVGLDTEKIRDYFYALKGWQHALGTLTFDAYGDPVGLPYSIKLVKDGKLEELEVYTPGQ